MSAEPEIGHGETPSPEPGPNRMLVVLVGLLGITAIGLLVLLLALLWPKSDAANSGIAAAGYPIVPVRSILGFDDVENGALADPIGVAFDPSGRVWISDTGNGRVLVFDQDGALIRNIGEDPEQPGNLFSPYGIAFDEASGRAYVADFAQGFIKVYDTESGTFITTWPNTEEPAKTFGKGQPFAPFDVEVIDGRVAAATPNGLWFFDQNGLVVGHWGAKLRGSEPGEYNFPDALAVDEANHQIVVADTLNKRIVALDSSGTVQWISGRPDVSGETSGYWQLPRGVAIGPECNVYVVDTFRPSTSGVGDGFIQVLSPDGALISSFGADGDAEGAFSFPDHIAYYAPGDLWAVADRAHGRILLFKLTPLPAPDENNQALYPKTFFKGPMEAVASPGGILPSPSGPPGVCPGPTAAENPFPWWIIILIIVLLLTWWAVHRIRKNRREREAAALAAATSAAGAGEGTDPLTPEASRTEETPPDQG